MSRLQSASDISALTLNLIVSAVRMRFAVAEDAAELESRINNLLVEFPAVTDIPSHLDLAGAGEGHAFATQILIGDNSVAGVTVVGTLDAGDINFVAYEASDATELPSADFAARQRIEALPVPLDRDIEDVILAGAPMGTRFMALLPLDRE